MLPHSFETSRVRLRPVAVEDGEAIFGTYAQDEEVARYLIWRPHLSLSETKAYVERCMATPAEVERTYMLLGREDNLVRGAFALRQRAPHRLDGGGGGQKKNAGTTPCTLEQKPICPCPNQRGWRVTTGLVQPKHAFQQ